MKLILRFELFSLFLLCASQATIAALPFENIWTAESDSGRPTHATMNGKLFFTTRESREHNSYLWQSDGTTAGTKLVTNNIQPESSFPSYISKLISVNDTLYFISTREANTVVREQIYTLGTINASTGEIVSLLSTPNSTSSHSTGAYILASPFKDLIAIDGSLYFILNDRLWKSDGTSTGTIQLGDSSLVKEKNKSSLFNINETLFFTEKSRQELWKSDGTLAGTTQTTNLRLEPNEYIEELINVGNKLFIVIGKNIFTEDRINSTHSLWFYDGSFTGKSLITLPTITLGSFGVGCD